MSKPARPKHSGSSVISIPSDAELTSASSLSPRYQQRFYNLPVGGRPSSSGHVTDSAVASSARTLRVSASRASLHAAAYEAEQVQKSRNVLRRKTSARSNPATPTAATFKAAQTESVNATPRKAGRSPDPPRSSAPRRTASATAEPVSVTRRHRTPPSGLTPAGAVAHAYKQQEQLREELSEVTGWNEYTRGQSLPDRSPLHEEDDEEASGAYYTVFGSTTGKVVAVGTAGDSSWDLTYGTQLGPEEQARLVTKVAAAGGSPATSHSSHGVRSLGRKVSGRFKKPAGSPPQRFAADTVREGWTPYDGRQSFQHDRRPVTPSKTKSSVPSLDEYVEVQASPSSIPSVPNGSTERSPMDREGRSLRAQRSHKPKELEKDEESPGGKLWKLMKRISTGGLRDKYVARDSSPPPVPALPKDFQHLVPSRTTFDIRPSSSHGNGTIPTEMSVMRFMNSRTSMSVVRPSTAPQKSSPRAEAPSSRPSTGARPSTTTRSSSPMSSDIASSRFFNKTHSTRSSISSYGEELPPMPKAVGNHIMSPSELYKLNKDGEDPIKGPRRSKSRPRIRTEEATSPEDNQPRPSLRPPRRSGTGGKSAPSDDALPPSPVIPTFSTLEPINNFSPPSRLSLPTSEFGVMDESTPPRPKRSSRRKAVPSESASSDLLTPISPPMPVTPRTPHSPNLPSISVDVSSLDGSHSSHSHSTARDGAQNVSPSSASSNPRSPLRFRELELSRSRLTEKEKADKWDDLLMRSDQAGGTLHIGETGLMSDNIRFSEYSEI
ncbi:hypothetical protein PHLCEN_2v13449 [Hermanssonia centrifuga]|uniref:Uncharacterized protein n=1 Tax=Hermanssonia centrifuga TaxID=98765 RepID=A0A2R6NEB9_9APHY|nr:hypothetical protein PHLCEN_2v13449 [Hermanssonia centrifuga]